MLIGLCSAIWKKKVINVKDRQALRKCWALQILQELIVEFGGFQAFIGTRLQCPEAASLGSLFIHILTNDADVALFLVSIILSRTRK